MPREMPVFEVLSCIVTELKGKLKVVVDVLKITGTNDWWVLWFSHCLIVLPGSPLLLSTAELHDYYSW